MKIRTVVSLLVFLAGVPMASATVFSVPVDGDGDVSHDGLVFPGGFNGANGLIVGRAGTPTRTFAAVLPFELPAIPVGHIVIDANLSYSAHRFGPQSGAPFVDLYGLDVRAANTILPTDYFFDFVNHDPNAALIQDAILSPALAVGPPFITLDTDASADAALTAYLNDQITNGAVAGEFTFLRFNVDRGQAGDPRLYRIGSTAGNLGAVLTIVTAVPEPSTLALLLVGSVASVRRFRIA